MSKLRNRAIMLGAVIGLLGIASYAVAGGGKGHLKAGTLTGYEENPDISTAATGTFQARIIGEKTIAYKLTYSGLEGTVQQAHIHFGKPAVNGGISAFLCSNLPSPPAGTPACPPSGTVEGEIDAADVIGPMDRASSRAPSPSSSPRCAPGTPTRTSTRRSGRAARSARRSWASASTTASTETADPSPRSVLARYFL